MVCNFASRDELQVLFLVGVILSLFISDDLSVVVLELDCV